MKNSKSILIVTSEFPPQPGGIGNHAYNLALHLHTNGYNVRVIADQRSENGKTESEFDDKLGFSVLRIKKYNLRIIMYLKRIMNTYKHHRNVKNVIATGKFSLWNVALCSYFFKRNIVAIIHGTEVNFKSSLIRKSIDASLRRFNSIVAVSNYTKSLVKHLNRDIEVIANGINVSHWQTDSAMIELKGKPVLTTVGRVSTRKGQLNVIKHLPELLKHFPDLHYYCVGIPTESDAFLSVAEKLKVKDHVKFMGSVSDNELKQILKATDIFVMLSGESPTGDVEGFGIAILEANAIGIPAIGSLGCGIEDAIKSNYSGFLIDANNHTEFIEAITKILESPVKYKSEAKSWARNHDWNTIIEQYKLLLS